MYLCLNFNLLNLHVVMDLLDFDENMQTCLKHVVLKYSCSKVKELHTSQIYRLYGFVPNPCEIYYFMGLYCLHMNVMHYLNTQIMCTTFVCKQYK
jgi:hypothetical protein